MAARTLCVCVISLFKDLVFASPKQSLTLFTCKYPYLCHDATLGNFYGVLKFLPWLMVMMTRMTLVRICDTFSRMAEAFLPIVPSSITPPTWSSLWWSSIWYDDQYDDVDDDDWWRDPMYNEDNVGDIGQPLCSVAHLWKNYTPAKKLRICKKNAHMCQQNIYYTALTISIFTHNQLSVPPFVKKIIHICLPTSLKPRKIR